MTDLERGVADERAPLRPTNGSSASPSSAPSKISFPLMVAFAVLGLARPGISIADPGCVSKSYPGFCDDFARLGEPTRAR